MSIATVSRVMNGQANVAPDTRELVRRAVARLGAPAPARRGTASGAIYVRCPYVLTDYFGVIVSSIAETLDLYGRRLMLSAGDAARELQVLADLPDDPAIAGAILVVPPEPERDLEALRAADFPFVVVDPRTPLPQDIASVSAANLTARAHRQRPPGGPRPPADRRDRRPRRLARQPVPAGRPHLRAGRRRCAALPRAAAQHRAHRRLGLRRRLRTPRPAGPRPPRWSPSTTRPRSARCGPRTSGACGCPRTCRSPASTTST